MQVVSRSSRPAAAPPLAPLSAVLGLAALSLALGSCAKLLPLRSFFGGTCNIPVTVEPGINQNSPVPVEILIVYDSKLLKQVTALSAQAWFAGRQQFLLDNPPGQGYEHALWEWIPGQAVPAVELGYKPLVQGAVVFAGYFSPGNHRAQFLPWDDLSLRLGATDFTLTLH